jgi:hypothetical protein
MRCCPTASARSGEGRAGGPDLRGGAGRTNALEEGSDLPGHPVQFIACNGVLLARIEVSQAVERDEVNVQMRDAVPLYGDSDAIGPRGFLSGIASF